MASLIVFNMSLFHSLISFWAFSFSPSPHDVCLLLLLVLLLVPLWFLPRIFLFREWTRALLLHTNRQSWDGSSPSHPNSTSTEELKHLLCPVIWDRSSEVKDRHYKAHFVTASELVIGTKFQKYWARAPTQLEHMKSWQEFPGFSGEGKIHGSVLETELSPKQ